jgi:integrase
VALKKPQISKPTRSPRRPGESAVEWTVRNAWICPNTTGKWVIKYTIVGEQPDGQNTYRTTEQSTRTTDRIEAEDYFTRWRENALNQKQTSSARPTFRDVATAYRATRATRGATNDYVALKLCEFLGDDPVDTIKARRINELHVWLIESGWAPGSVRNYLSVALTLLRYAEQIGMLPEHGAPKYKMPPVPASRPHVLTEAQDAAVFAAAAAWGQDTKNIVKLRVGLFVCIALSTAQRRDAIRGLTWDRINWLNKTIDFTDPAHQPKNKRRCAAVPIRPRLMAVLRRAAETVPKNLQGNPTGPVFASHKIIDGFHAFRDALDMPDWFTPHVFRHTWVTLAWGRGVPPGVISKITGDDIHTLERTYAHLHPDTVRDSLERFLYPDETEPAANNNEDIENVAATGSD